MQENMTKYALEVSRFGFRPRFKHEEGRSYNVSHDLSFSWRDLKTDGKGNVHKSPLLIRKPCFGRPEAFIRTFFGARTESIDADCNVRLEKCRCDVCPIFNACEMLCQERIDGAPTVKVAVDAWFDGTDHLAENGRFKSTSTIRLWSNALHAIRIHGGWTNINDVHVIQDKQRKHEVKKKVDREAKRSARRASNTARRGHPQAITSEFLSAVAAERDHRLRILQQSAGLAMAPRWISKLDQRGMRRTADVWEAQVTIAREGLPVTGRAVSEWLVLYGKVSPANPSSLTTTVHRDFDRIAKLEREIGGVAIWARFTP